MKSELSPPSATMLISVGLSATSRSTRIASLIVNAGRFAAAASRRCPVNGAASSQIVSGR